MSNEPESISVLLVEDNEIDVEIAKRVLNRSGIDVRLSVARDGKEALDLLCCGLPPDAAPLEEPPRLIVLDLGLPGIDGYEVLRRIKNDPDLCPIPVAVLTGNTDQGQMLQCLSMGGNMFFIKPMTVADVARILKAVQKYWLLIEHLQRKPG
jgi:CheY-like chemotaxis protein